MAKAVAAEGANAITVANTYPAMAVDHGTRKSRLGNLTGGLSGPAIKPITLRLVWEASKAVEIPVLGLGGIETANDVLDYTLMGATAVQVGTASFTDPRVSERLVTELRNALFTNKLFNINELRGKFLAEIG
jgi:dihydroorotate dehydrogenase (NAD+) catalytic subunit